MNLEFESAYRLPERQMIREAAAQAGLTWGGTFPGNYDPVHFEYIPPDFDFDSYVDNFSKAMRLVRQ